MGSLYNFSINVTVSAVPNPALKCVEESYFEGPACAVQS